MAGIQKETGIQPHETDQTKPDYIPMNEICPFRAWRTGHSTRASAAVAALLCCLFLTPVMAKTVVMDEYVKDDPLPAGHGFLIIAFHAWHDGSKIYFEGEANELVFKGLNRGYSYHLVTLPAGTYVFDKHVVPGYRTYRFRKKNPDSNFKFKVEAGKINYVGEIVKKGVRISYFFNIDTITRILEIRQPDLLNEYELVVDPLEKP